MNLLTCIHIWSKHIYSQVSFVQWQCAKSKESIFWRGQAPCFHYSLSYSDIILIWRMSNHLSILSLILFWDLAFSESVLIMAVQAHTHWYNMQWADNCKATSSISSKHSWSSKKLAGWISQLRGAILSLVCFLQTGHNMNLVYRLPNKNVYMYYKNEIYSSCRNEGLPQDVGFCLIRLLLLIFAAYKSCSYWPFSVQQLSQIFHIYFIMKNICWPPPTDGRVMPADVSFLHQAPRGHDLS